MLNRFAYIFRLPRGAAEASPWATALLALLTLLLLVQLVRLIWTIVTPLGPVGDARTAVVQPMPTDARRSLFTSFDPYFRSQPQSGGAAVITSLQLTLYGIRQNVGSGLGSAILAGPDGVQESYAVGDEVSPGVTLESVEFDHVLLNRGGVIESLYLDQSVPAQTVGADNSGPPSGAAPAPAVQRTAESILGSVGFAPRDVDGRITGIVVSPQGDGTLFRTAGFRDGDIITQVNGRSISSSADIDALRDALKPGARLSLMVERGADTVPIALNLDNQ